MIDLDENTVAVDGQQVDLSSSDSDEVGRTSEPVQEETSHPQSQQEPQAASQASSTSLPEGEYVDAVIKPATKPTKVTDSTLFQAADQEQEES